jgi:hypothetical protein
MKTSTKHTVKVILFSISLLAVAGISLLFYLFHKQLQTPQTKAMDAIPSHAALFFESTKPADFFLFHSESESLFNLFLNEKQQQNLRQMLSMVKDFDIEKNSNTLYLSAHFSGREISLLLGIEVDRRYNADLKKRFQQLTEAYRNESFIYKSNEIRKLHIHKDILHANYQNGLLLLSFDESLIRASIDQMLLKDSALYNVVHSFAHKRDAKVSTYLYLQYSQCEPVFKKIMEETCGDVHILRMLSPFSWAALSVKRKNEFVVFSGYATVDTTVNLAKLFTHKDKMPDIGKMLPSNAQGIFCIYSGSYKRFAKIKPYVQTSEDVLELMSPNQLITFTINHNDSLSNALLLVSENVSEAAFHLFHSVGSDFAENNYKIDTFYIDAAMVGTINLNNFVLTHLGYNQHFPKLRYYTVWDSCIVFTDTKAGMISYIQHLREGKTLQTSANYQTLSSYFSSQSNMLYYSDLQTKHTQNIRFQYDYFSDNLFLLDAVIAVK